MSSELIRLTLGVVILGHGIGHVLFMPAAYGFMKLPANGHSWLLTSMLGDGITQLIATAVAVVAVALFTAGAYGLVVQAAWWRPVVIVGAVVSIALVAAFWDGFPTSSAFFAVAFDVIALVALLVVRWPSEGVVGA